MVLEARYKNIARSWEEWDFFDAMRYALEWSWKRLRPILACLAYEDTVQQDTPENLLEAFLGIECIHAYTLVHDDLPAMDNDTLRRGKPTVWKQYGETMAILVGDALQTVWFELLARIWQSAIIGEISHALGDLGVVRWQVRDTLIDQETLSLEELLRLHDEKTGGFIAASILAGALAAGATKKRLEKFRTFGMLLGRAFQIRDDILDAEGDAKKMGKQVHKDAALGKGIVTLCGGEYAKSLLREIESSMHTLCEWFDDKKWFDVVDFVVHRDA